MSFDIEEISMLTFSRVPKDDFGKLIFSTSAFSGDLKKDLLHSASPDEENKNIVETPSGNISLSMLEVELLFLSIIF